MMRNGQLRMKLNLVVILSGIFLAFSCNQGLDNRFDQSVNTSDTAQLNNMKPDKSIQSVEDIQEAYSAVVKQIGVGALDSVSFEYSCGNGERSGRVIYYSQDGDLRLIVHRFAEYSHYSAEEQYFVRDSILFFTFLKEISWSFEDGPEGSVRDNITERRIYVLDQEPVKCLEKKYVIRSQIKDNPRPESLPNKEVGCTSSALLIKKYPQLVQHHRQAPASGCLEVD